MILSIAQCESSDQAAASASEIQDRPTSLEVYFTERANVFSAGICLCVLIIFINNSSALINFNLLIIGINTAIKIQYVQQTCQPAANIEAGFGIVQLLFMRAPAAM